MSRAVTQVCDVVAGNSGWNLATLNNSARGANQTDRAEQLVFRLDHKPAPAPQHWMVLLRSNGMIEVTGQGVDTTLEDLLEFFDGRWQFQFGVQEGNIHCTHILSQPTDLLVLSGEVIEFFLSLGWRMDACSASVSGTPTVGEIHEQYLMFTPNGDGASFQPHLLMELYMGMSDEELFHRHPEITQLHAYQFIRLCPIGTCDEIVGKVKKFILDHLGGALTEDPLKLTCDVFMSRRGTDNNLAQWSMRVTDFMLDRLGFSIAASDVKTFGPSGQLRSNHLAFRYEGELPEVPLATKQPHTMSSLNLDGLVFPRYWRIPEVLNRTSVQETTVCNTEEVAALQAVLDTTFHRVLTRDRNFSVFQVGDTVYQHGMPYRLEVVTAFLSEHAGLYQAFGKRLSKSTAPSDPFFVKTMSDPSNALNQRLDKGSAYLFHGTNPSSAMSILKSGFHLERAGLTTGKMFGRGIYLCECSSKADEYARDSRTAFPGLRALLVCRAYVGNVHVVTDAGDSASFAAAHHFDCVCGDRETKVQTYREFVFFDESQVVPEFAVIYRRQHDANKVPAQMRTVATGTNGRSWQILGDDGWVNVSDKVNAELTHAKSAGRSEVKLVVEGAECIFDMERRLCTFSNRSRKLRPPMRG